MSTLYVDFCMNLRLPCANASVQNVILCLRDAALVIPTGCPSPSDTTYEGAFAEATICQAYTPGDCTPMKWYYTFSYDSAILADITVPLQPADILGAFCLDCLTNWLEYKIGDEVFIRTEDDDSQTLVSQHGCEYPIVAGGSGTVTDVSATAPITSSGGTTPDISTSMSTNKLIGRGTTGTGIFEEITLGTNLSLTGTTLNASGGGGGGGCINDVTTAQFNTLLSGSGFTAGCFYTITDHSQNRIPANTRITVLATDVDTVTSECSVLTSYDPKAWRGVYDSTTNTLMELADNQGNYCSQYTDGFRTFTCVSDFDWGNPGYTNCFIESSTFTASYGSISGINALKVINNSLVVLTGYTGNSIYDVEVSNFSELHLSSSAYAMEEVFITNTSSFTLLTQAAVPHSSTEAFIFNVISDYSFVSVPADSLLYMEAVTISGLSLVTLHASSSMNIVSCSLTDESQIITSVATTISAPFPETLNVQFAHLSGKSRLNVTTAASKLIDVEYLTLSDQSLLTIDNAVVGDIHAYNNHVDTNGTLTIASGTVVCDKTSVSQSSINTGGFALSGVYAKGVFTKTASAANTNTGKDYFNDSII